MNTTIPGNKYSPNNKLKNRIGLNNSTNLGDLNDFSIRFDGHPKYNKNKLIETDPLETIIQKLEMVLYTNKGDVYGDPNFGADLENYLWSTDVATDVIEDEINKQIRTYIPELKSMGYLIEVNFFESDFRDIMQVKINIKGYNFSYIWS
jgi:hypothetical protein